MLDYLSVRQLSSGLSLLRSDYFLNGRSAATPTDQLSNFAE